MPQQDTAQAPNNLLSRIWYSIFRASPLPHSDRKPYQSLFNTLILHFRPRMVPEKTLEFTLTWGLGGMAVVLMMLSIGTGLLLKFVYQPFPDRAYDSIIILQNDILFGQFVRNIHHWSGNFLLIIVFLHLLRVFFTGAFQAPRQFNWIIGLSLFFLALVSNFTGYLMPWDQLAFWAVTICIGMLEYIPGVGAWLQNLIRGGAEIGPATLLNFFAIHTAIIPACLVIVMPFHFWRVRKAGGIVIPRDPDEDADMRGASVTTIPNLILRELVVALAAIAFILFFALLFNAPLGDRANPGLSPNPTKAPWYFAGIQEMLMHFHPLFAVLIGPAIIVIALALLPYVKYDRNTSGVWFASHKGRRIAKAAAVTAVISAPLGIVTDEFLMDLTTWVPALPAAVRDGLIPVLIMIAAIIGFYALVKKKYSASNNEAIQAVFILLVVAYIILTVTGVWFRGAGMELTWPWKGV
jgi:quinol-cytochrome oxidoreductase complex cytochrome b subunit